MAQLINLFDYYKTTEDIIKSGIPQDEVFDIYQSPEKCIYLNYYWTWQTMLSAYDKILNVYPARFFFINNRGINACGGYHNGIYLVGITVGLAVKLKEFFIDGNDDIFGHADFSSFDTLSTRLPDRIQSLMRDFSIRFVMDHEFGHVIQQSGRLSNWTTYEFGMDGKLKYSLDSHLKEYDADIRGAIGVASVVIDYWYELSDDLRTAECLNALIISAIASITCLFSLLYTGPGHLYLHEYEHPHSVVRVQYIIEFFQRILHDNLKGTFSINWDNLFVNSWKISNLFLQKKVGLVEVDLVDVFMKNEHEIRAYIDKTLAVEALKNKNLALHRKEAYTLPRIDAQTLAKICIEMPGYGLNIDDLNR